MSSPKGFATQQRITGVQSSDASDQFIKNPGSHVTIQPQDAGLRYSMDTVARFLHRVGSQTVPLTAGANTANTGKAFYVHDIATAARIGDVCRFEDGLAARLELPIVKVETNGFYVAVKFDGDLASFLPAAGDTFYILRYVTQRTTEDGSQLVTLAPTPVAFVRNTVDTEVNEDTAVPANNLPLPVRPLARAVDFFGYNVATTANITTLAYIQLKAATAAYATEIEVDNTTGKSLILAFGAAASEVNKIIIPSKGLSRQALAIPAGTRLSVKALNSDTESVGEVNINLFA